MTSLIKKKCLVRIISILIAFCFVFDPLLFSLSPYSALASRNDPGSVKNIASRKPTTATEVGKASHVSDYAAKFDDSENKGCGFRFEHKDGAFLDLRLKDAPGQKAKIEGEKAGFAPSPGMELEYTFKEDKVKEDIVLASRPASNTIDFLLSKSKGGLSTEHEKDGYHFSKNGEELFWVQNPNIVDAQGKYGDIGLEIDGSNCTLTIDQDFLETACYPVKIDPTVVGTSTSSAATYYSTTRKVVKTSTGTLVQFYQSGSDVVYRTSADSGATWSTPTIASPSNTADFSVCIDSSDNIYLTYYHNDVSAYVFFKKLTYSVNNTWTIGTEYTVESTGTAQRYPSVAREDTGKIWVAYRYYDGTTYSLRVKSSNDGITWSTSTQLGTTDAWGSAQLVLWKGKPACFYEYNDSYIKWRYFDGSIWSTEAIVTGTADYDDYNWGSIVVTADNRIHLVCTQYGSYGFVRYTYYNGSAWSTLPDLATNGRSASLSTDGINLWCFWSQYVGSNQYKMVYKKNNGTSWDSNPTVVTPSSERTFDKAWTYHNAVPWDDSQTQYDTVFRFYNGSTYYGNQIGQASNSGYALNTTTKRASVKFVADASKTAAQLRLYINKTGTAPTYRVGIQGDSGGYPNSTWINGGTCYIDVTNPASGWQVFNVPDSALTAGTTYHIVMQYVSGTVNTSNYACFGYMTPNSTSGEGVCTYSGTTWSSVAAEPVYVIDRSDATYEGQSIYGTSRGYLDHPDKRIGERFTPTANYTPTSIGFYMCRTGTPTGSCLAKVYDASNNQIFSGTIATPSSSTTMGWLSCSMSGITLTAGATYRVVLQASGVDSSNYYTVQTGYASTSSPYPTLTWANTTGIFTRATAWSGWNDKTNDASNTFSTDVPLFSSQNDSLYVGLSEKFDYTYFYLATNASATVSPTWQYWNGTAWANLTLTQNPTYGFTSSSNVRFNPPADWQTCVVNGSSQYWVRITRTAASVSTFPVATQITPIKNNMYATTIAKDNRIIPVTWTEGLASPYNVKFSALPATDPLGMEGYYSYQAVGLGGGISAGVSVFNGNLVVQKTDVAIAGRGIPTQITHTYNSRSVSDSPFGFGWDLSPNCLLTEYADGTIVFKDKDGTRHIFSKKADGTYNPPPGVYLTLTKNPDSTYLIKDKGETRFNFDATGKITSITDVDDNTSTFSYDASGKLMSITDASARITNLAYDANGRLANVTDPANRTTTYSYDAAGNLVTITDAKSAVTTFEYDGNHNLTAIIDANNHKTSFTYNTDDTLASILDARSTPTTKYKTKFSYDFANSTTKVTDPNNKTTTYTYNFDGNVTSSKDPLGNTVAASWNDNAPTKMEDANGNMQVQYDANGNPIQTTETLTPTNNATITATYDDKNNPTSVTDPNDNTKTAEYNEEKNLLSTANTGSTENPGSKEANGFTYDSYGNLTSVTEPGAPTYNLVKNSSFEQVTGGVPDQWFEGGATSAIDVDSDVSFYGQNSAKISSSTSTTAYLVTTYIAVSPWQKLTLSCPARLENVAGTYGAAIGIQFYNANGQLLDESSEYSNAYTGTGNVDLLVTAEAPSIAVSAKVVVELSEASGTAWFDGVQLESPIKPEDGYILTRYDYVENSSFERDLNCWHKGGTIAAITIDSSIFWAGTKSVKMTFSGSPGTAYIGSDLIPVKPNENLTLSGFIKTENLDGPTYVNGAHLEVDYYDANMQQVSPYHYTEVVKGTHNFTRYAIATAVPSNAEYAIVWANCRYAQGTVWFDNLKLIPSATTKYTFDANGNYLKTITDPTGNINQYDYDSVGNMTSQTNPKGSGASYSHDSLGNVTQVTDAANNETYYGYDPVSLKEAVRDARSSGPGDDTYKTTYGYNEINSLTSITDPLGRNATATYGDQGNLESTRFPNGNTRSLTYDDSDRLSLISYNNEPTSYTFSFNEADDLTQVTDNGGKSYSFTYDMSHRPTSATDMFGYALNCGWDNNGNLVSLTDSNNQTTNYTYGSSNQVLSLYDPTDPGARRIDFDYDESGRVMQIGRGNGLKSVITYDLSGRAKQVADPGAPEGGIYLYDYDQNGNVTSVQGQMGTNQYTYDSLNRLTSWTDENGLETTYSYDPVGNLMKVTKGNTVKNGSFETYTEGTPHDDFANWDEWSNYDGFTIQADTVNYHQGAVAAKFTNTVEYMADALMLSDYIEVDENQRYACYSWWKKLSGITFIFFGIRYYDQNKNPIGNGWTKYFENSYGVDIPATWTQLGGIIYRSSEPAQYPFFAPGTKYIRIECLYADWVGSAVLDEVTLRPISAVDEKVYAYNEANEITNPGFAYDPNGNLTSDGTYNYIYNCENQLKEVKKVSDSSTVATYTYNYKGLRASKTTASGTIRYHYDDNGRLVRESDSAGATIATYAYAKNYHYPLSMTRNGQTYYFHTNAHGDIVSVTDVNRNRVATYSYDPWGKLTSSTGTLENPFRYAGYYYDTETGLYYLKARYYSPETCRFLTKDAMAGYGGAPLGQNSYLYCAANPVNIIDPEGLWGQDAHWWMTVTAARCAGFGLIDSRRIAFGSWLMDEPGYDVRYEPQVHINTSPPGAKDSRTYHFQLMFSKACRYWGQGKYELAFERMGRGLHAVQDMYSHDPDPIATIIGHIFQACDIPAKHRGLFCQAIDACVGLMFQFREAAGLEVRRTGWGYRYYSWSMIHVDDEMAWAWAP